MVIRSEIPSDAAVISGIVEAAFVGHPHSANTEHLIVDGLRKAGALTLSLVAEVDGEVAGHVAFSPVRFEGAPVGWYGLGPVAVRPDLQKRGIGGSLIEMGLEVLRASGASGCVLVGEPGYYGRFGFVSPAEAFHEGVPQEYFLALSFGDESPRGPAAFHEAFFIKR